MARVNNNGTISGRVGDLVFRTFGDRTVVSRRPDVSCVKRSAKQKEQSVLFRAAVAYAKSVAADPKMRKRYENKLVNGQSVFNAAVSDYMKKPRIDRATPGGILRRLFRRCIPI